MIDIKVRKNDDYAVITVATESGLMTRFDVRPIEDTANGSRRWAMYRHGVSPDGLNNVICPSLPNFTDNPEFAAMSFMATVMSHHLLRWKNIIRMATEEEEYTF